jgi:hypothetical protein
MTDMNPSTPFACTTCPGTSCTCGCQENATQAACACGPQCQCGQSCTCPQP